MTINTQNIGLWIRRTGPIPLSPDPTTGFCIPLYPMVLGFPVAPLIKFLISKSGGDVIFRSITDQNVFYGVTLQPGVPLPVTDLDVVLPAGSGQDWSGTYTEGSTVTDLEWMGE